MKESLQEKIFKEAFPESIRDNLEITSNYQKILLLVNDHLKTIYGNQANLEKCSNAYFCSSEYRNSSHNVKNIENVKLLESNNIKQMIIEDEQYSLKVNELIKCYQEYMQKYPNTRCDEYLYKLAALLGILPENNTRTLFTWILQKKGISPSKQAQFQKSIRENIVLLDIITNTLTKLFIPGFLLEYPSVGSVMTQQRGKYYYRGENAFYKTSRASIFRGKDNLPAEIRDIVICLRIYECWNLLDRFDSVKHWSNSSINYMALAQHYGLKTQMIDITSDLKTALFFACCRYGEDLKWHPLKKSETELSNSRDNIKKLGGDSRYGILYRTPTEITDIKWALADANAGYQLITPVGYQPFMRCSNQHSYMMLTNNKEYDMLQDPLFEIYKILLDEDFCNWIYKEMDYGEKVYPHNDIPDISQEIEKINRLTIFSESVFQAVLEKQKLSKKNKDDLRKLLESKGIAIQGKLHLINAERIAQINLQYPASKAMDIAKVKPQMTPLIIMS